MRIVEFESNQLELDGDRVNAEVGKAKGGGSSRLELAESPPIAGGIVGLQRRQKVRRLLAGDTTPMQWGGRGKDGTAEEGMPKMWEGVPNYEGE